jgi:hypothetical protein
MSFHIERLTKYQAGRMKTDLYEKNSVEFPNTRDEEKMNGLQVEYP